MEVSLNNNLRYGVQAYLKGNDAGGGIFGSGGLTLKPSFPGMNFFVGSAADPRVVVDALSAVTKVRIVSSPSVLVLENETATIKVGDQVPVKTQETNSTTNSETVTNSFEYRDTGVILTVKPRVTASGIVTIELGQQLSSVTAGSGKFENPTFSQRSITSKVSVPSSQTVLLGGLISGTESRQKDGVPGVNKIPIVRRSDRQDRQQRQAQRAHRLHHAADHRGWPRCQPGLRRTPQQDEKPRLELIASQISMRPLSGRSESNPRANRIRRARLFVGQLSESESKLGSGSF